MGEGGGRKIKYRFFFWVWCSSGGGGGRGDNTYGLYIESNHTTWMLFIEFICIPVITVSKVCRCYYQRVIKWMHWSWVVLTLSPLLSALKSTQELIYANIMNNYYPRVNEYTEKVEETWHRNLFFIQIIFDHSYAL